VLFEEGGEGGGRGGVWGGGVRGFERTVNLVSVIYEF